MLISLASKGELWFLPSPAAKTPVEPSKVCAFGFLCGGIVETEPDVFHVSTGKFYNTDEGFLNRVDLRGWEPGREVKPEMVLQLPKSVRAPNGSCLVAPNVMFMADSRLRPKSCSCV
jgi:hypothetical protein